MGKASSNKKVARAAKAGGSRARAAGERNVVFPMAIVVVVALGLALIVYARDQRQAVAELPPLAFEDHWHSSYGYFICDEFLPELPEYTAPQNGGTHTHGDGLLHIHPFSTARSGDNATLANWAQDAAEVLGGSGEISSTTVGIPGNGEYTVGEDTCEGVEGEPIVQVLYWDSAAAAVNGDDPEVITENFRDVHFDSDGEAFVIAFAPEGAEIGPPPSTASLGEVGTDLGVDAEDLPEELQDETDEGDAEADADAEPDASTADDAGTEDTTTTIETPADEEEDTSS